MPRHGSRTGELIGLASVAGLAGGAYKFGEFLTKVKRLHEVGDENAVFVRLQQNVQADLRETERLLYVPEVKEALRAAPEKVRWIRDTIRRVRNVLEDMAKLTGRVGDDLDEGKHSRWGWLPFVGGGAHVGIRHRFRWVLDEKEKLLNRRMELAMAHQSLGAVLDFLGQFEPMGCCDTARRTRSVEVDVVREVFDERDGKGVAWEERDGDFVEKRRTLVVDELDKRRDDGVDRDLAFAEGREDKIIMVDREKDDSSSDPGYGYLGGMGSRMTSDANLRQSRRAYDFDEPGKKTVIRKKRVYDYDVPDQTETRETRVYEYDTRDRGREADVLREERVYKLDGKGKEKEVYRERMEYESDRRDIPLRTHSHFSSLL